MTSALDEMVHRLPGGPYVRSLVKGTYTDSHSICIDSCGVHVADRVNAVCATRPWLCQAALSLVCVVTAPLTQFRYVTHSSFVILLPLYLAGLKMCAGMSMAHNLRQLQCVFRKQTDQYLAHPDTLRRPLQENEGNEGHINLEFMRTVSALLILFLLTVGLTIPSVSWFLAVPLTSMANITAIYNTFSIWALVFSVYFLNEPWKWIQVFAVVLGALGVAISAYGSTPPTVSSLGVKTYMNKALLGNVLALLGAVSMAAYEIMYKKLASVSDTSEVTFEPLANSPEHADETPMRNEEENESLPFGLHAIAMTTGIGIVTLLFFWIPLLLAHLYSAETFELPTSTAQVGWIVTGIICGVTFNGCFTILLSLWGPVLASMSCLLTTVLVQLTDMALGVPYTWISFLGSMIIAVSFACLLLWGHGVPDA